MPRDQRYDIFQKSLLVARQEAGLTQQEVSLRLQRPQSFVSKYESGERGLDVIEFLDVCRAIGAEPQSILNKLGVIGDQ